MIANQITGVICPKISILTLTSYLVVGGGGGAGAPGNKIVGGGGGGAGGYRTLASNVNFTLPITVTVGGGGAGGGSAANGNNSVLGSITSSGGGSGGIPYSGSTIGAGKTGGSGGGAAESAVTGTTYTGGTGNSGGYTPVEGYNGGNGGPGSSGGGGSGGNGGGSSAVGQTGVSDPGGGWTPLPAPTNGTSNSITGSAVTYATGGRSAPAWNVDQSGAAGTANTGNGGNGGIGTGTSQPGNSGVVIIKYADTITLNIAAGLTSSTTSAGGFKTTRFTAGTGTVDL